jgi:hypothetical protein
VSTADACDREAAWLSSSGDGLPALVATAGGPFGLVQAYWPRTPGRRTQGQLYVLRNNLEERRFANQRVMVTYAFQLALVWPLQKGTGSAEDEQRAFDTAIDLVLTRVRGYRGDKTHGGRFLSAAEDPRMVRVVFDPPGHTIVADTELRASVTYTAQDPDFTA